MIPPFIEDGEGNPFMRWPQDFAPIHPRKDAGAGSPDADQFARPDSPFFHAGDNSHD